jgi:hypothetical protein
MRPSAVIRAFILAVNIASSICLSVQAAIEIEKIIIKSAGWRAK